MSIGKYTNKEILQHATDAVIAPMITSGVCPMCKYYHLGICTKPRELRSNTAICAEVCKKWLASKESECFPQKLRDEQEREIDKEREHIARLLDVLDYFCLQCKQCGEDTKHCTPDGCSIRWAQEKYKTEEGK